MTDDGDTKDDVKIPDGEVGEKIIRLFKTEEKDTSEFCRDTSYEMGLYANKHFRRCHPDCHG